MSLECPACHSQNVQKLSLVHSAGISSGVGIGVGVAGGGLGLGAAKTMSQTALSKSAAPPPPSQSIVLPMWLGRIVRGFFGFLLLLFSPFAFMEGSYIVGLFLALGGGLLFAYGFSKNLATSSHSYAVIKREAEQRASQNWGKTFMCHSCGERFIPR